MADEGFLGNVENDIKGVEGDVKGVEEKGKGYEDKVKAVAQEHGLDPNNVENWPEEAKQKLHM